jgi:hypothetical protein
MVFSEEEVTGRDTDNEQYPAGILPYLKADKKLDAAFIDENAKYEPPCKSLHIPGTMIC